MNKVRAAARLAAGIAVLVVAGRLAGAEALEPERSERRFMLGMGTASTQSSFGTTHVGGIEVAAGRRTFLGIDVSKDRLEVYDDRYSVREEESTQVALTLRVAPWPAAWLSPYCLAGAGGAVMRIGPGAGDLGLRPAGFVGAGASLRVRSGLDLVAQTLLGFRSTTRVRTQVRVGVSFRVGGRPEAAAEARARLR